MCTCWPVIQSFGLYVIKPKITGRCTCTQQIKVIRPKLAHAQLCRSTGASVVPRTFCLHSSVWVFFASRLPVLTCMLGFPPHSRTSRTSSSCFNSQQETIGPSWPAVGPSTAVCKPPVADVGRRTFAFCTCCLNWNHHDISKVTLFAWRQRRQVIQGPLFQFDGGSMAIGPGSKRNNNVGHQFNSARQ